MAAKTFACTPFAANNVVRTTNGAPVGPCSVFFPSACNLRRRSSSLVRAQAAGENKDTAVDVHHLSSGQRGTNKETAVERRPRRLAVDVSPFGEHINSLPVIFILVPSALFCLFFCLFTL